MPAGPLVLCAVLRLAEGPVTAYEVGALSEARGQLQEQRGTTAELGELEIDPKATLMIDSLTAGFSAAYAPRLWLTTRYGGLQSLHRAAVQASLRPDPLYRLTVGAVGATGTSNLLAPRLASLGGATPGPIQVVGAQTSVRYVFGEVAAGVDATPTARTRVALNGAWLADGGGDAAARVTLPLQRGPRAALAFDWQLTADDQLAGEVLGSRRSFTTRGVDLVTGLPLVMPTVWVATLTETWRRKFDKEFSTWAGAGLSISGVEATATTGASVEAAPVIDTGLQFIEEGGQRRLRLSARYGPIIDAVTGRIYQRIDWVLMATLTPSRSWRLIGELTGGLAVGGLNGGQTVATADVRMAYNLSRELELTWGARGYWQEPGPRSGGASYRLWGLFVGMAYLHKDTL